MNSEEIAIKLTEHDHEIGSLKHRMNRTEEQTNTINNLAISVKELAINMTSLLEEQKKTTARIDKIEGRDGDMWRTVLKQAVTILVAGFVGYMISNLGL